MKYFNSFFPLLLVCFILFYSENSFAKWTTSGTLSRVHQVDGPVEGGDVNQKILKIVMSSTAPTGNSTINSFSFNLINNTEIASLKIVYPTAPNDSNFANAINTFGSAITNPGPSPSFSGTFSASTATALYFFWLVMDAKATVTNAIIIDASLNGFTGGTTPGWENGALPINPTGLRFTSRNYKIGTGDQYPTLFETAKGISRFDYDGAAAIFMELTGNYSNPVENTRITFSNHTGPATIIIRPQAGQTSKITQGNPGSDLEFILFSGAQKIILDGRPGGTGTNIEWTFRNSLVTAPIGSAFGFANDATNDTLRFLNIMSETSTSFNGIGIIHFSNPSPVTGNDNNAVLNCKISDLTGGTGAFPYIGVSSLGFAGKDNNNITIKNCEFVDIFKPSVSNSSNIFLGANNNNWTIENNHFYQTTSFSGLITNPFAIIQITSGGGHTISGNFIGGTQPNCLGTAYTISAGTAEFYAIVIGASVTGGTININGNTISNLQYITTMTSSVYPMGAMNLNGSANIVCGSSGKGNIIGGNSGSNNILLTNNSGTGSLGFVGIYQNASGTNTIAYNTFSGIIVNGTKAGASSHLINNFSGTTTVNNNTFGTFLNNISVSSNSDLFIIRNSAANGIVCTNNIFDAVIHSATTAGFGGILNLTGNLTATGNTFQNISSSSNSSNGAFFMIDHEPSGAGVCDIENNTIQDISLSSPGTTVKFYGLSINTTSNGNICSNNTIGSITNNNISLDNNASNFAIYHSASGSLTCTNNIIQEINITNTGTSAFFAGIYNASTSGQFTANGNTIRNIDCASTLTGVALAGIYTGATTNLITKSNIQNLNLTGSPAASTGLVGIYNTAGTVGSMTKNFISGLYNSSSVETAWIYSIYCIAGAWDFYNNIILLDNAGNSNPIGLRGIVTAGTDNIQIYHNTVKIYGSISSGSTVTSALNAGNSGSKNIKNNIFQNLRTGPGTHYSVRLGSILSLSVNNNYLQVGNNQNQLCYYSSDNTFTQWKTNTGANNELNGAISLDANGVVTTIPFAGAGLGIDLTATVPDDKLDVARGKACWMGAYEGQNITTGAISPLNSCAGTSINIPYTIGGSGSYNGGNIFTAQLSGSSGDFSSPTNIGTLASSVSGTINATIPLTAGSATYTTPGSFIWTCPVGVTKVTVECWGGGGGGGGCQTGTNSSAGGGGAGGSYAKKILTVVPGNNYTVNVGNGGLGGGAGFPGTAGNDSWFNNSTTVKAQGGAGGTQGSNGSGGMGSSASSIGDVLYPGGSGGIGMNSFYSGGGGGGAGSGGSGGSATGMAPGGGTPSGGGSGGSGGGPSDYNGMTGMNYGGGGSGGYRNTFDASGAMGAGGKIDISYHVTGSGYRIRVVSSDPLITGSDNGSDINIQTGAPSFAPSPVFSTGVSCNGYTANWGSVSDAATYYLDVATDAGFSNFVTGYNNLDVGNVTSKAINGLIAGTTYYFRVRAANGCGTSGNSSSLSQATNGIQRVLVVSSTSNGTITDGVSLRWAITEANNNCGNDSIHFGFGTGGPFNILLTSALPAITGSEGVTIDGFNNSWCGLSGTVATDGTTTVTGTGTNFTTQISPGALININGEKRYVATVPSNATLTVTTAFSISATTQTAYKECVSSNNGIPNQVAVFDATASPVNPMNPVYKITLDNGGSVATGFVINSGSDYNVIKGLVLQNFGDGTPTSNDIAITVNGNYNKILGCYIGMDASGTTKGSNTTCGLEITGSNNSIGDGTASGANLISGMIGNYIGLRISGSATGNMVKGNMVGLQKDGTTLVTGQAQNNGISVVNTATSNIIGGTNPGEGNVISGNLFYGISCFSIGATGTTILGNIIGPRADGVNYVTSNSQSYGIYLAGSSNNTIGGNTAGARNIISANEDYGVYISGATATGNVIKGNYIGLDKNGTNLIAGSTQNNGIYLTTSAASNTIGGNNSGEGNVISGNSDKGIYTNSAASSGNTIIGNILGLQQNGTSFVNSNTQLYGVYIDASPNNTIGGNSAGYRNIISGNETFGVVILDALSTNNVVKGNYIGIDKNGNTFVSGSSQDNGVRITLDASANIIGGSAAGEGNVISGNSSIGVYLVSASTTGNMVIGNIIGPQADGISYLASNSQSYGVEIINSLNNTIGGNTASARNIISANEVAGVYILGALGCYGNVIKGNYIGIDKNGNSFITGSTQDYGIFVANPVEGNIIGGSGAGEGNVISGNSDGSTAGRGIYLASGNAAGTTVWGNLIGPQADGVTYLASNAQNIGITITNSPNNTIGGSTAGTRNIISANGDVGLYITGSSSTGNAVKGNFIGPSSSLTNIASSNQDYGVYLDNSSANNSIGTGLANQENQIAYNTINGVYLTGTSSTGNLISQNPIYNNSGNPINLNYGVNQANNGIAAPAILTASQTVVSGTSGIGYTIEVFKNTTGNCFDAVTYVGTTTADGAGNWSLAVTLSECDYVLATATDGTNNTSEFSACLNVPPNSITTSVISPADHCAGVTLNISYTVLCPYNPGNIFTVQLSDATGSFAAPTNIGSAVSQNSGTITTEIPSETPTGLGYRIRIISTDPPVTGADNGINQSISVCSRYWINGAGNWNDTNNWSDVSGGSPPGTGGATVPHKGVHVYLDANSFTGPGQMVTLPAGTWYMKSFNPTGFGQQAVIVGQGSLVVGQ